MKWEQEEVELLKMWVKEGWTYKDIANELDRTENTVKNKASRLGITKKRIKHWDFKEEQILKDLFNKSFTVKQIAEKMDRSYNSVKHKIARLHESEKRNWNRLDILNLKVKFYQGKTDKDIAKFLNRGVASIEAKRKSLNLIHEQKLWTKQEENLLLSLFNSNFSDKEIANKLNRSISSISSKRYTLDLKRNLPGKWSNKELNLLYYYYGNKSIKEIAKILGRTEASVVEQTKNIRYPGKKNEESSYRRASKLQATPSWANKEIINRIYEKCKELQSYTNKEYHVDHIIPLKGKNVCGLHHEDNLQILMKEDNLSKSNKLDEELLTKIYPNYWVK